MTRFRSLRSKLIILCVLSIALPFIVAGVYTYIEYTERVETRSRQNSQRLLRQVAVGLERYIKLVDDLSLAPLYNDGIVSILKKHSKATESGASAYTTAELMAIMRFLAELRFDRNEMSGVKLYSLDGVRFAYSESFANDLWSVNDSPWIPRVRSASGAARIVSSSSPTGAGAGDRGRISLIRLLREPFTHAPLGYIQVEFTLMHLEKAIFPTLAGQTDYLLLIYNAQEELLYPATIASMAFVGRNRLLRYNGKDYISSTWKTEPSGLSLYSLVPYAEVTQDAQTLTIASVLIALVAMIAACFVAILMADRIVSPLRKLAGHMTSVREGRFDTRVLRRTNDEVGELAEDFNLMTAEIQRLIDEVYRVSLKEQEAEILLLQSQINPHFIYNTLETISMMAVERGRMDISDTVTRLGKMLRFASTGTDRRIPLSSELAFAEHYMAIQSLRFGSRVRLDISVPSGLVECLVPKLCIQPLVENVIEHALGELPVRIGIHARKEDGDLVVSVENDGKCLSSGEAAVLEARIRLSDRGESEIIPFGSIRKGIALRNIHQRIVLMYGSGYGISVESGRHGGARFSIRVQFQKGGEA